MTPVSVEPLTVPPTATHSSAAAQDTDSSECGLDPGGKGSLAQATPLVVSTATAAVPLVPTATQSTGPPHATDVNCWVPLGSPEAANHSFGGVEASRA